MPKETTLTVKQLREKLHILPDTAFVYVSITNDDRVIGVELEPDIYDNHQIVSLIVDYGYRDSHY